MPKSARPAHLSEVKMVETTQRADQRRKTENTGQILISSCVQQDKDLQTMKAVVVYDTYPVQVSLRIFGKVKVDDHVDSLNVNSTGEEVCSQHSVS